MRTDLSWMHLKFGTNKNNCDVNYIFYHTSKKNVVQIINYRF